MQQLTAYAALACFGGAVGGHCAVAAEAAQYACTCKATTVDATLIFVLDTIAAGGRNWVRCANMRGVNVSILYLLQG